MNTGAYSSHSHWPLAANASNDAPNTTGGAGLHSHCQRLSFHAVSGELVKDGCMRDLLWQSE